MPQCSAYNCTTSRSTKSLSLHSFPKDEGMRLKWAKATRRKNFKPTDASKLCSLHFTPADFDENRFGGTWLKKHSVPSIFNFDRCAIPRERKKLCSAEPSPTEDADEPSIIFNSDQYIVVEEHPRPVESDPLQSDVVSTINADSSGGITTEEDLGHFRYVGDFSMEDVLSPRRAQKFLLLAKKQLAKKCDLIRMLQQKTRVQRRKIDSLTSLLKELRGKTNLTETASDVLLSSSSVMKPEENNEVTETSVPASLSSTVQPKTSKRKKARSNGKAVKQKALIGKALSRLEPETPVVDNTPTVVKVWGEKLTALDSLQRIFAEKAINDILYDAALGNLSQDSVRRSEPIIVPVTSFPGKSSLKKEPT